MKRRLCISFRVQQAFDLDVEKMLSNNEMYKKHDSEPVGVGVVLVQG